MCIFNRKLGSYPDPDKDPAYLPDFLKVLFLAIIIMIIFYFVYRKYFFLNYLLQKGVRGFPKFQV